MDDDRVLPGSLADEGTEEGAQVLRQQDTDGTDHRTGRVKPREHQAEFLSRTSSHGSRWPGLVFRQKRIHGYRTVKYPVGSDDYRGSVKNEIR